ncbi:MAG: sigma-70 family RNA polymerase sigma factor [Planctomycetota bacterium]
MDQAELRLWVSWREQRDQSAFEALVSPHLAFAVDFARRIGCAAADADDLVQQALVALARNTDGRPAKVGLRAWLGRTISLGARTLRRTTRRRTRREQSVTHSVEKAAAAQRADPVEDCDEVDAALEQLESDERQVLVLRFLHDLEYREVAHVMGSTPAACRLKVHRALAKLRVRLGKNATALLATGTLLLGAMPASALTQSALHTATATATSTGISLAHTITGGVLVMGKFLKAAVVVAVVLLVSWWWDPADESAQPRTNLGAGAAGAAGNDETLVAADGGATERSTAKGETDPNEGAPTPASGSADAEAAATGSLDDEWASYDQTRAMGKLGKRMRGLSARLDAIRPAGMPPAAEPPGKADETTRLHLEELVAKYKQLAAGSERLRVFRSFVSTHKNYITRTRDPEFLPFVESVANSGSATEQPRAIAGLYGVSLKAVVDLLRRALANPNPTVLAGAVDTLAEIKGSLADEAHDALIAGLRDEAANVRWTTAMALEFRVGKKDDVEALLPRLPTETHPIAMHAMVRAVLALDPDEGRLRLDAVMEDTPAAAQALYQEALEREEVEDPMKALQADLSARASKVRPAKEGEVPPADRRDPDKREYLDRLAEEALNMPTGPDRLEHIKSLASEHREYLRETGDTGLLPMLDKIVHNSPSTDERRAIINSLWNGNNADVVTLLIAWSRDPAADIRGPALGALSAVSGERKRLARAALVARLRDDVVAVRRNAALFLGNATDQPDLVEPLLDALSTETDFAAAYSMVRAVKKIDPKTGRARIDKAVPNPNAKVKMAIDRNYG